MARKTRSTSQPWAGKPAGKRNAASGKPGKPDAAAPPEKPPLPATPEACCEAVAALCKRVDEAIPAPQKPGAWGDPVQRIINDELRPLMAHLDKLLNPPRPETVEYEEGLTIEQEAALEKAEEAAQQAWHDAYQDPREYLLVAMTLDRGVMPSWSRPSTFLMWFGPLPVRVTWPGLFGQAYTVEPCLPNQMWFSALATVSFSTSFYREMPTVRNVVASAIQRNVSGRDQKNRLTARLCGLRADEALATEDYLLSHRWLAEALKRGPVDPVPMDDALLLAQPPLMA